MAKLTSPKRKSLKSKTDDKQKMDKKTNRKPRGRNMTKNNASKRGY